MQPAAKMALFDEAYRCVQSQARLLASEHVALPAALGRILAQNVTSDMDMPPFDKSAMDGYACRREDLAGELRVIETIPAGTPPRKRVGRAECSKIMTGAIVPPGADCVVQVEHTAETATGRIRVTRESARTNICRQGEDLRTGDPVLHKGERIGPRHIAVLATVGCTQPKVARRPRVGIIATGNELVEPDATPNASQIRNSNGQQLCAQTTAAGALPQYYGIAPDTLQGLDAVVKRAAGENDVILLSGGVSMGDYDLVPGILEQNGFRLLFRKVAVKPGKPTVFGVAEDTSCFGLPGNPVSTFVIFEILVRPFLFKLMGHDFVPFTAPMTLQAAVTRRGSERDSWIPVRRVEPGVVREIECHGPAHVNAFCGAEGLICVRRGVAGIAKGTVVDVRQIQ